MQKLGISNNLSTKSAALRMVLCTCGLATVWYFIFKRLKYPVLFTYIRTGNNDAFLAQGVHNAVLVLSVFLILFALSKAGSRLFENRASIAGVIALGALGGLGLALLGHTSLSDTTETVLACVGGALVGLFTPVYIVFWGLSAWRLGSNSLIKVLVGSFALFAIVEILLSLFHADSLALTIICPPISAILALILTLITPDENAAPAQPVTASTDASLAATKQSTNIEPTEQTTTPLSNQVPDADILVSFGAHYALSRREIELTALAYKNYNARRIASELFIAESTVYTHLKRIYKKTDVHSKQELIDLIDSYRSNY